MAENQPKTREEIFLKAIADGSGIVPEPVTREEMFLAKAAGMDVPDLTPITRKEMFLKKISESVGGSGGEETKYYTVNFYNGDELLQSVSVPQGGNAIYTGDEPVKEGEYAFAGFVPDGTNITEDTDCYAQFRSTELMSKKLVERTISGEYVNETITSVGENAFHSCSSLTSVNLPAVTNIATNAFQSCSALTSVNVPILTSIGDYAFRLTGIKNVYFPNVTDVGAGVLYDCKSLVSINLPKVTATNGNFCNGCSELKTVDFAEINKVDGNAFYNCSNLTTLILRSNAVCTLGTNVFVNTPIARGTGYIYVPSALVDSYKNSSGWTTFTNQIRAIEDYPEICGGDE